MVRFFYNRVCFTWFLQKLVFGSVPGFCIASPNVCKVMVAELTNQVADTV